MHSIEIKDIDPTAYYSAYVRWERPSYWGWCALSGAGLIHGVKQSPLRYHQIVKLPSIEEGKFYRAFAYRPIPVNRGWSAFVASLRGKAFEWDCELNELGTYCAKCMKHLGFPLLRGGICLSKWEEIEQHSICINCLHQAEKSLAAIEKKGSVRKPQQENRFGVF